jgi:hypothetical protein
LPLLEAGPTARVTKQRGEGLSDPALKKLHDQSLALALRLRKLPKTGDRERHLFQMIRNVEYAWAGVPLDLAAAQSSIAAAEQWL